jgi:hypothetical protein
MVSAEEFAHEVTKSAVAHACVALGVGTATSGALEALTDVASHYTQALGRLTKAIAERGGRSEANLLDVMGALAAMPKGQKRGWRELRDFAFTEADETEEGSEGEFGWDQPFHHSVPAFPVTRTLPLFRKEDGGDGEGEGRTRSLLVPDYLPPLPPRHTYKRTRKNVATGEEAGSSNARMERVSRKRQAEQALLGIQDPNSGTDAAAAAADNLCIRTEADAHFGELPKVSHRERPPRHKVRESKHRDDVAEVGPSASRLEKLKKDDLILEGMLLEGADD